MRFHERQIVLILDGRYGDVATIRQRRAEGAPEEFVHLVKPANVGHKTEPVGVTEVMIHAAVISICRSGHRIRKGKASNRVGAASLKYRSRINT